MVVKLQKEIGVVNFQRLEEFPPALRDKSPAEVWPTPAEIWSPIKGTAGEIHVDKWSSSHSHKYSDRFNVGSVGNLLKQWETPLSLYSINQCKKSGEWLPLDTALEWSQKRGSVQPKRLKHDDEDWSYEYSDSITQYNQNMNKYLNAYLCGDSAAGAKVIYMATSFETKQNRWWPVFLRFSFDEDLNEWRKNLVKHTSYVGSEDPYLIELKSYRRGRSFKIGLFSNADKVDIISYPQFKGRDNSFFWMNKVKEIRSSLDEDLNEMGKKTMGRKPELPSSDLTTNLMKRFIKLFHKDNIEGNVNYNYKALLATPSRLLDRINWVSNKTLTTKKNRNQVYLWVPSHDQKYNNPTNQLGLFNWSSAFWEGKT